jgi:ABC-type transporter Mla maintaining outer membrane lipid asymmetry ATPase subunit MlaF
MVERPSLERRLVASLDAGRIPVLVGGCGMGRTSVLLRLARQVRPGQGVRFVLVAPPWKETP